MVIETFSLTSTAESIKAGIKEEVYLGIAPMYLI